MTATASRQIFAAEGGEEARERLGEIAERLTDTAPKVAAPLEGIEKDLLGFCDFPTGHGKKLRSCVSWLAARSSPHRGSSDAASHVVHDASHH